MRIRERRKYTSIILALSLLVVLEGIFIFALWIKRPAEKPAAPPPAKKAVYKGAIAIVIDDWGYNQNNLAALEQIKLPVTAAVLPHLAYSRQVAQELHNRGCEIILHLPMEPYEKMNLEKNTVMTSMDSATISRIIGADLESIAYAKGISNHMGSRATEDERTMKEVFREMKQRRLYFFDSYVTPRSVAGRLAGEMDVRFARRDIFLDNKSDPEYIKGQIQKLKNRARLKGYAIGIGHDRASTLAVLKEELPQLKREGYKLVFVSELTR